MEQIDQQDVPPGALESRLGPQLRAEGFDVAAIVMLGGVGAGTSAGFWVRFVMVEDLGVWAMEFMHSLTGFADLYTFGGNMGDFDEMAGTRATHPSAYTKAAVGWLDSSAIASHTGTKTYQPVGLIQPPPSGRVAAIRIGSEVPYVVVEARQRVDQFDARIPSEGVIVYRIQTTDPLGWAQNATAPVQLLTPVAMKPGDEFVTEANISVKVSEVIPGGSTVVVHDRCETYEQQIAQAQQRIEDATSTIADLQAELPNASPAEKAAIMKGIREARAELADAKRDLDAAQLRLISCRKRSQ
jgi:hypothetical protein